MSDHRARVLGALGLSLALFAVYVVTSAGRIDIIDGQVRYEVAANWLDVGEPVIRDGALARTSFAIRGERATYATYNAGASLAAMPLMALARALPGGTVERDRFAFSMTGPLFGGALAGMLVIAYGMLGLGVRAALSWTAVTALATLWWPGSVTVFDQNQHAFFLLASLLLAWQSARRASPMLAAVAGLVGGLLLVYQEIYVLLLPFVGLLVFADAAPSTTGRAVDRAALLRYLLFGVAGGVGLIGFVAFNYLRFGATVPPNRYADPLLMYGNPLAGLLSLAVSPGKSILLFSPPVILAVAGARGLYRQVPVLAAAVGLISLVHVLLVVQLPFFGGDWCWGPRYLLILVPLWALAAPFALPRLGRAVVGTILALGLVVQLMGVSMEYQRFFLERDLPPYFWADQWVYFKRSQFFARPRELATLVREGVPAEATRFSPTPGAQITYTPAGPPRGRRPSEWMRQFAVFFVPRPWPAWIARLEAPRRPVAPWPLLGACAVACAGGLALAAHAVRSKE